MVSAFIAINGSEGLDLLEGETNRRRAKQVAYNELHGIVPLSIHKAVRDITERMGVSAHAMAERSGEYKTDKKGPIVPRSELQRMVEELEKQMKLAAKDLEFEKAAALRDEMYDLRAMMVEDSNLTPLKKIKILSGED